MGLTRVPGPLAGTAAPLINYRIDGPKHRLLMHPFPRRVRAEIGGATVLDTRAGMLLHETGLLPQLYVPEADLRPDLLEPSELHTHCPFKGEASYRSMRVAGRVAENAIWHYPDPIESAAWLRGYAAMYWQAADRWFDEDDEVFGHLTDPFTRVDIRGTGRPVRVLAGHTVLAESTRALVLSETGLPNRYYLPAEDVARELLVPSDTRTVCPYKGTASYWSLRIGDGEVADVAWEYRQPLPEAGRIAGHLSFLHEGLRTEVDGLSGL
jgi:uncharacterized protein (DUF427 family)